MYRELYVVQMNQGDRSWKKGELKCLPLLFSDAELL